MLRWSLPACSPWAHIHPETQFRNIQSKKNVKLEAVTQWWPFLCAKRGLTAQYYVADNTPAHPAWKQAESAVAAVPCSRCCSSQQNPLRLFYFSFSFGACASWTVVLKIVQRHTVLLKNTKHLPPVFPTIFFFLILLLCLHLRLP